VRLRHHELANPGLGRRKSAVLLKLVEVLGDAIDRRSGGLTQPTAWVKGWFACIGCETPVGLSGALAFRLARPAPAGLAVGEIRIRDTLWGDGDTLYPRDWARVLETPCGQ
jgi:hypothetical protein